MSKYINLNRIEFGITGSCSGKCKHCSNTAVFDTNCVNVDSAVTAIIQLTKRYEIESLMTFGGEPLLYSDVVCKIHATARDCGIPVRQLITNGYFASDKQKIETVASSLCMSGVNNIAISVDAFHQEYIPIEPVIVFAESLIKSGVLNLRVHPAWLVNEQHGNPFNNETKKLLKIFNDKGIETSSGNNIFPSGSAIKHFSDYFPAPEAIDLSVRCGSFPYTAPLDDIDSLGINPNGDVHICSISIGNIYNEDIIDIIDRYDPYKNPTTSALLSGGVVELLSYAESKGAVIDISECRSACGVCRKIMNSLEY